MAVFNFGNGPVDGDDENALKAAVEESGTVVGGSVVGGNSYGITGGTVNGNVYQGEEK